MLTYPSDWEIDIVKNIANITTGCRDTQDNKCNGSYPFFVRSPIVERIDVADFDCEAVLTAGDGNAGKVFHYINGKFAAHQRVYVMSNFRKVTGKYFYYYFSKNFIKEVVKYTAKSTVDSVRRPMIAEMKILYPSIHEQQEVVNVLQVFDDCIDNLEELIKKKKDIRKGALEDLMGSRSRLNGYKDNLIEVSLGSIAQVQDGTHGTFKRQRSGKYLLSAKNVFDNKLIITADDSRISEEDYSKITASGFPKIGDILLSCVGTIGRACLMEMDNVAFQRSVAFIRVTEINNKYLLFMFQSSNVQKQLNSLVNASAQGGVYLNSLRKIKIKITKDSKEQKAIADILIAMDQEIEALEIELAKMREIREGVSDVLLTGRIRLVG